MQVTEQLLCPGDMSIYPLCPRCNTTFEHDYQRFCGYCGQRLKWTYYSKAKTILPKGFYYEKEYDEENKEDILVLYYNPYGTH